MHDFFKMMRQYASPYKGYLAGAVVLNMLSAIFNIFSFAVIVPLLNILFKVDTVEYAFIPWGTEGMKFKDILVNNAYWLVSDFSAHHGAVTALLLLCLIMIFFTALKTSCYFGSAAVMIPIRTGIVKDIRNRIYNKILALPIGFFSQERKGDIIARMSGDVNEVENSITASIEMLIKDPILILFYFGILIFLSPEMMLVMFTLILFYFGILIFLSPEMMLVMFTFVPAFVWIMGVIGKQLKRQSLEAQTLWSDTMAQVEETLGGLRIIKAFNAEKKMSARFEDVTDRMRRKVNRVNTRQASAHPVSEFLGTVMIMAVLAFGGYLIIRGKGLFGGSFMDASQFIFFMIILYSVIEPIKELSRATYGIPKGLASMERINRILEAENPITECENPQDIKEFHDRIAFENVSFSYESGREVLKGVNLAIPRGKMVAIVGESGAGKSTLVDLIPRFYDATGGRITIDGKDVKDLRIKDLRALMGNVNQDPILFNDTIFNNIAFGVERLSIARAILKNPPILILDEATASLDTESERIVQDALDRLMSSRTTIDRSSSAARTRNSSPWTAITNDSTTCKLYDEYD